MQTTFEQLPKIRHVVDDLVKEIQTYLKDTSSIESHLKSYFHGDFIFNKVKLDFIMQSKNQEA